MVDSILCPIPWTHIHENVLDGRIICWGLCQSGLSNKSQFTNLGVKIPYFTQAILSHSKDLSIDIRSITMGDPTIGNYAAMIDVPIAEYMYQHNSTLNVPDNIQSVFDIASSTCGFNQALEELMYPPSKTFSIPGDPEGLNYHLAKRQASPICIELLTPTTAAQVNTSIFNGCFGPCATWTTAQNYMNATRAWYGTHCMILSHDLS